jgi:hypothetical protein
MLRLCVILLLLFGNAPSVAAQESKGPHLSDLMRQPSYRESWKAMLAGETAPLPDWVASYATTLDSPPTPLADVPVGSQTYTLAFTCKPNECGDNQLFVLFAPAGRHAWGLLLAGGGEPRWLGKPDDDIKRSILRAVE